MQLVRFVPSLSVLLLLGSPDGAEAGAHGRPADIEFRRLSLEAGLSQSSVYCIHQDHAGYLWFGTADGLNRIDGYGFTVYRRKANNSTSLSDNTSSAICEDSLGHFWLGTMAQSLNRLDPLRGRVTRFEVGSERSGALRDGRVRALATDRFGRVWVGTQGGGVHVVDPPTGSVAVYTHEEDTSRSLPHNTVRSVLPDEAGLWIGTDGGGLCRLLWKDSTVAKGSLLNARDLGIASSALRRIHKLYRDRERNLWVGRVDEGATRIAFHSTARVSIAQFLSRGANPTSITGDIVQAFGEDELGALGIGTWGRVIVTSRPGSTSSGPRRGRVNPIPKVS